MKVAIVHSIWGASAERLKEWLDTNGHKSVIFTKPDVIGGQYDVICNFGWGSHYWNHTPPKYYIGNPDAVNRCVDKRNTFRIFKKAGIPIPQYTFSWEDIDNNWPGVICRESASERRNKGMTWVANKEDGPKGCELYTEEVPSRYEWRIVVFKNEVVGRYHKQIDSNGIWQLNKRSPQGFELLDEYAIKAAKALNIDYVGFDVVGKNKKEFWFLEANSAATLQDEAALAITEFINQLKV